MTKLEKLREVNQTLSKILVKLETHIFIENIDIDNKKNVNDKQSNLIVEIKQ